MKDFSQMTDEELDNAIIQKASGQIEEMDYGALSDDELDDLIIQKSMSEEAKSSPVEAFAQSFGNAATFGYLPQIQAITEPAIQGAIDLVTGDNTDQALKERGFDVQSPKEDSYVQRRDKYIASQEQLAKENPVANIAGGVTGSIASGIATGGALGKLLGTAGKTSNFIGRAKEAAKTGAAIGAIRNPGDTEGEVNLIQVGDRLKNAASDAATGLVVQGGLEGAKKVGEGIKHSGKAIKTFSQMKALKGSGAMLKDFRKALGNKKAGELGQSVIDEGLIKYGDDVADIAKNSEKALKESGGRIGAIYNKADEITSITSDDIKRLNNDFLDEASERLSGTVDGKQVAQKLDDILSTLSENKNPTFSELRKLRASIDDQINYSKATQDLPKYQDELLHLRNKVQELVKKKIGDVNPSLGKELSKENKRFSNIAEITKIAKDKMAREESNAAMGLRERISGGVGAVVGGMIGSSMGGPLGTLTGAAIGNKLGAISTKVARQYGTPFVALTANKVARALEKNQDALGKFSKPLIESASNPEKFVATVNMLMKDPDFKKKANGYDSEVIYRGPAKRDR